MIFSVFLGASQETFSNPLPFRFHLASEPHSLDPALHKGSSGSYLFHNLFRSLYHYDHQKGLLPEGKNKCRWKSSVELQCELDSNGKWSDGSLLYSKYYVTSLRRIVDPQVGSPHSELLLSLKNAPAIVKGHKRPHSLGVQAPQAFQLNFHFEKPDPEFLYKLSLSALAPQKQFPLPPMAKATELVTNGPYQIQRWLKGKRIHLKPNPYYPSFHKDRPFAEAIFVEDESTALTLFQMGRLDLLRRVPSHLIAKMKSHPGFFQNPVARFDYLGFGPELKPFSHFREALAYSLRYEELKELYKALGRPGCPSLPPKYMDKVPCYHFDLKRAKEALKKAPPWVRKKRWPFYFSKMGGNDILKGMQWIANQWEKHLHIKVSLQPREQNMYLQELRLTPPALFRKGVPLGRPTCLAGLEVFQTKNPENFIRIQDSIYDQLLFQIGQTTSMTLKRQICRKAVERLLDQYLLIPMGEIHFSMIHSPRFKGWRINELNQLDLSELIRKKSPK